MATHLHGISRLAWFDSEHLNQQNAKPVSTVSESGLTLQVLGLMESVKARKAETVDDDRVIGGSPSEQLARLVAMEVVE